MRACVAAGQVPEGHEEEMLNGFEGPHRATFCCWCGSDLAAFGTVSLQRRLSCGGGRYWGHLSYGLVHPHHHGKGLGHVLLEVRLAWLATAPVPHSSVTLFSLESVLPYHERHGFQPLYTLASGTIMHLPLSAWRLAEAAAFLNQAGIATALGAAPVPPPTPAPTRFMLRRPVHLRLADLEGEIVDVTAPSRVILRDMGRYAVRDGVVGGELLHGRTPCCGGLKRGLVKVRSRPLATWRLRTMTAGGISLQFCVRALGGLRATVSASEPERLEMVAKGGEIHGWMQVRAADWNEHWWGPGVPEELAYLLGAILDHHSAAIFRVYAGGET